MYIDSRARACLSESLIEAIVNVFSQALGLPHTYALHENADINEAVKVL